MPRAKDKTSDAMKLLAKLSGGPLTLGRAIESVRKSEELTQLNCAKKLRVSKSHLCDVEKGRKTVSPERAAKWGTRGSNRMEAVLVGRKFPVIELGNTSSRGTLILGAEAPAEAPASALPSGVTSARGIRAYTSVRVRTCGFWRSTGKTTRPGVSAPPTS